MKIIRVIDLHYSTFIFEIDQEDKEEMKRIQDFIPKAKILWRVIKE